MTIKAFKLNSGEEIIADIVKTTDTHLEVTNPIILMMGQNGLNFIPSMAFAAKDTTFKISNASVAVEPFVVEEKLENVYRKQFGSGIEVVSTGIITG